MNDPMRITIDFGDKEEDTAPCKLGCVPKPSPLPIGNPGEIAEKKNRRKQFIIALKAMEHRRHMAYEARRWIGVLVHKEINDKLGYLGKVHDYDEDTELYKIMYDQENYEELTEEELMKIVAPPHLAGEYLALKEAEEKENMEKSKVAKAKAATKKRRRSSKRQSDKREKAKKVKASDYIPLALCEKKRDDYYWY